MNQHTVTIVEFILERVAEDEDEAWRWAFDLGGGHLESFAARIAARVEAKCEAKRAIVGNHDGERSGTTGDYCSFEDGRFEIPCPELRQLAAVYASHPDYDPAWAPES